MPKLITLPPHLADTIMASAQEVFDWWQLELALGGLSAVAAYRGAVIAAGAQVELLACLANWRPLEPELV